MKSAELVDREGLGLQVEVEVESLELKPYTQALVWQHYRQQHRVEHNNCCVTEPAPGRAHTGHAPTNAGLVATTNM